MLWKCLFLYTCYSETIIKVGGLKRTLGVKTWATCPFVGGSHWKWFNWKRSELCQILVNFSYIAIVILRGLLRRKLASAVIKTTVVIHKKKRWRDSLNSHLFDCVLLMVRFCARLARLDSKSPVMTFCDAADGWGTAGPAMADAPVALAPGCSKSPNASKPVRFRSNSAVSSFKKIAGHGFYYGSPSKSTKISHY